MPRRPLAERIAELDLKGQQLEARKQALQAQAKSQQRRERTRELIQIGGVLAAMGVDTLSKAQLLQRYAVAHPEWWRSARGAGGSATPQG